MFHEIGVIGLGPAGCFFLACLPTEKYASTIVFESGSVGGDLGTSYGSVIANLTCAQLVAAFRRIPRWSTVSLDHLEGAYAADVCPRLADVALQLRVLMEPIVRQVTLHSQQVREISQVQGGWQLDGKYFVGKVVVCTGGVPRCLECPRPAVPLATALDHEALRGAVLPTDRVVVFGTAHSGTLILRNLRDIGCTGVTAVYKTAPPFRWALSHTPECPCHLLGGTGCHDSEGLKQESAIMAAEIVRKEWGALTPRLLWFGESEELNRCILEADWIVCATGFQARCPEIRGLGGEVLDARYDPRTGQIAPGAWGFGMAYPALYEKPQGGVAPDIGLPGFAAHILACMDTILNG